MVAEPKGIAPKRYREPYGRYFEDFEVGALNERRPGRTIFDIENTWFALRTMNQHLLHFDEAYAAQSEFGKPSVSSALTPAVVTGMSVSGPSQKAIGNLGWDEVRLSAPVFNGDTTYAESEVLVSFERSILVSKRGHAVDDKAGY